jgi:hypothetical protein
LASIQVGDTFLLAPDGHLWVVISDSATHAGCCIIVNLTGDVFRAGKECELAIGDHQWITKKTYVSFGDARKVTPKEEAAISKLIASGAVKRHHPMKSSVLQKIIGAAKTSKAMPEELKSYL